MVTYQFTTYPLDNGSNDKRVRVKRRNAPQNNKDILIKQFLEWILNTINTYIPVRYEPVVTGVNIVDDVLKRIHNELKGENKIIENSIKWILERIGSVPSDPDQLDDLKNMLFGLLENSINPFFVTLSNVNHINDPDSTLKMFLDNEYKKEMGYFLTILMTPYNWNIFREASKKDWEFLIDICHYSYFNAIMIEDVIKTHVLPGINNVPNLLQMIPNIQDKKRLIVLYYNTLYNILAHNSFSIKEILLSMIKQIRIKVQEKYRNIAEDVENRLIAAYFDYCVRGSVADMSRTPQQTIKAITNMGGRAKVKKYSTIKLTNDTDYLEKIFAYLLYCKDVKSTLNAPRNNPSPNFIQRLTTIYVPFDGKDNDLNNVVQWIATYPDIALDIIRTEPLKSLIKKDTNTLTKEDGEKILRQFIEGFKMKNKVNATVNKGGGTRRKRANRRKTRRTT